MAGGNGTGYDGDGGPATAAMIDAWAMDVDEEGNIYLAGDWTCRIRMVDSSGIITTIAGTGSSGYSGDGLAATVAELKCPLGVAVDPAGDVYE